MSDVLLYQSNDDGEINFTSGIVELTNTPETAVYLSLFGGNEEDDGRGDNPLTWWGNIDETDPARQYRSETQFLLQSMALVPRNLRRLEDAVKRDLAWFQAKTLNVIATIPAVNRIKLVVQIDNIIFVYGLSGDKGTIQEIVLLGKVLDGLGSVLLDGLGEEVYEG